MEGVNNFSRLSFSQQNRGNPTVGALRILVDGLLNNAEIASDPALNAAIRKKMEFSISLLDDKPLAEKDLEFYLQSQGLVNPEKKVDQLMAQKIKASSEENNPARKNTKVKKSDHIYANIPPESAPIKKSDHIYANIPPESAPIKESPNVNNNNNNTPAESAPLNKSTHRYESFSSEDVPLKKSTDRYESFSSEDMPLNKSTHRYESFYSEGAPLNKSRQRRPNIPYAMFGKANWAEHLGDIGIEPSLPSDIEAIMNSPCPYWPGQKVKDTHILVLIPQTVNGKPLTLRSLGDLVKAHDQPYKTQYRYFWPEALKEYGDTPAGPSRWMLMTKDVIPGSRGKSPIEQQKLMSKENREPKMLEAAVCIFMELFRSGTRIFGNTIITYTRCKETTSDGDLLAVGGFSLDGLHIDDCDAVGASEVGVAALREL